MLNYTSNSGSKPQAFITFKKSRKKIYDNKNVYLNDNDEFEIELYNPSTNKVLAKIKINGTYISSCGLVLKPGERIFLDRFLDVNKKFKFSTYNVEKINENLNAIQYNGNIEIEFYNENYINDYSSYTTLTINPPFIQPTISTFLYRTGTTTSNVNYSTLINTGATFTNCSNIETGRIEKGNDSKQEFNNDYSSYYSFYSSKIDYKILPHSQKNTYSEDIKHYCTSCGAKVKKEFKFCPTGGKSL
jgi:hypothetical protein